MSFTGCGCNCCTSANCRANHCETDRRHCPCWDPGHQPRKYDLSPEEAEAAGARIHRLITGGTDAGT